MAGLNFVSLYRLYREKKITSNRVDGNFPHDKIVKVDAAPMNAQGGKKMPKTKKAFALKDFDETRIFQRRFFKDFHFAADKTDAEILQSLTREDIPLESLEENQRILQAAHGQLNNFHNLLIRHQRRLDRFNKLKAERLGIKVAKLQADGNAAPMIEYVTADFNVIDLIKKFEKSYYELEKKIQKRYRAEFAASLKRARLAAGLTQKQLGDMIQISQNGYGLYESGKRDPSIPTLFRLLRLLPADQLLIIRK